MPLRVLGDVHEKYSERHRKALASDLADVTVCRGVEGPDRCLRILQRRVQFRKQARASGFAPFLLTQLLQLRFAELPPGGVRDKPIDAPGDVPHLKRSRREIAEPNLKLLFAHAGDPVLHVRECMPERINDSGPQRIEICDAALQPRFNTHTSIVISSPSESKMHPITRRRTLAALSAGAAATGTSAAARRSPIPGKPGIKLAMMLGSRIDHKARVSRQIGCTHAISGVTGTLSKIPRTEYEKTLQGIVDEFKEAGLTISAVESHPVPAEKIKLGIPGRDEEIENYIAAIQALGRVGIPVICYNFMAGLGWYRTKVNAPGRGGALITEFDNKAAKAQGLTQWGEIPEEKIWKNIEYFLKAVIPVAEKANVKMALHPDDPPLSPLRGIGRIVTSAANYRRIMNLVPSPVNGITYCQANFVAMGEDIEALAK